MQAWDACKNLILFLEVSRKRNKLLRNQGHIQDQKQLVIRHIVFSLINWILCAECSLPSGRGLRLLYFGLLV